MQPIFNRSLPLQLSGPYQVPLFSGLGNTTRAGKDGEHLWTTCERNHEKDKIKDQSARLASPYHKQYMHCAASGEDTPALL